jgi:DNA repair ATPase RecN
MFEMDKCREEFEKQKYWIGLFRDAVDFDEELGRYVLNGQRKLYAFHLDSFNEKWAIWQEAWQHQQAKVEELQTHAQEIHKREIKLFEKTLILTHERDELQKRVDLQQKLLEIYRVLSEDQLDNCADNLIARINGLEQALKGEG